MGSIFFLTRKGCETIHIAKSAKKTVSPCGDFWSSTRLTVKKWCA